MGVDTWVKLPPQTRIGDVANAMGILLGKKKHWFHSTGNGNGQRVKEMTDSGWVEVEGVKVGKEMPVEGCVNITIDGWGQTLYHFENSDDQDGSRLMGGGCYGQRIALYRALVDVFGGEIDYNDCDCVDVDYKKKSPYWSTGKYSDEKYQARQKALWNLKPLSKEDIDYCRQFSSYDKLEPEKLISRRDEERKLVKKNA